MIAETVPLLNVVHTILVAIIAQFALYFFIINVPRIRINPLMYFYPIVWTFPTTITNIIIHSLDEGIRTPDFCVPNAAL